MDILKLFKTIEELVSEIALWIILIPKTIIRLARNPSWAHSYVIEESSKDTSEQYDQYMPPVLFWLLTGVIPFLFVRKYFFFTNHVGPLKFSEELLDSAIFLLSGPLSFAFVVLAIRKSAIGRAALKVQFKIQCYCFSMANLSLATGMAAFASIGDVTETISAVMFAVFFVWLIYSELTVLDKQFNGEWEGIIKGTLFGFAFWPVLLLLAIAITDLFFRGQFAGT